MRTELSEVSNSGGFLSERFGYLQAQVERLVGPTFERRSGKDRRRMTRVFLGRRESDRSPGSVKSDFPRPVPD